MDEWKYYPSPNPTIDSNLPIVSEYDVIKNECYEKLLAQLCIPHDKLPKLILESNSYNLSSSFINDVIPSNKCNKFEFKCSTFCNSPRLKKDLILHYKMYKIFVNNPVFKNGNINVLLTWKS